MQKNSRKELVFAKPLPRYNGSRIPCTAHWRCLCKYFWEALPYGCPI